MTEYPITQAIRYLREHHVAFTPHLFAYAEKGGTSHSSLQLGVNEHKVIKTLIMEDHGRNPLCILMHGDCEVSTKSLARQLDLKSVTPCRPDVAEKHSGYVVGGTSPFGLRQPMPIYVEKSVLDLPKIYINGGKRGFLVCIASAVLLSPLGAVAVSAARSEAEKKP